MSQLWVRWVFLIGHGFMGFLDELVFLPIIVVGEGTTLRAFYQLCGRFMRLCISSLGCKNAGMILLSMGDGTFTHLS
jgi:hypothetical protein